MPHTTPLRRPIDVLTRRIVATSPLAAVAALVAAVAIGVAGAAPAQAAAVATVRACFVYTNMAPAARESAQLLVKQPQTDSYTVVLKGSTGANGCATYYRVGANQQYAIRVCGRGRFGLSYTATVFPGQFTDLGFGARFYVRNNSVCR